MSDLTHWGRVTHICVSKLTIIASDNGLSPDRRQAIIWTNPGLLLMGSLRTNFSEILIEILTFSFTKMRLKVSSAKRRPFCLGFNELNIASGCYLWISFVKKYFITTTAFLTALLESCFVDQHFRHISVTKVRHHYFKQWLVACLLPRYY